MQIVNLKIRHVAHIWKREIEIICIKNVAVLCVINPHVNVNAIKCLHYFINYYQLHIQRKRIKIMVIVVNNQKTSKINKLKLKILKKMRIKLVETNFLFNNNQCQLKSLIIKFHNNLCNKLHNLSFIKLLNPISNKFNSPYL